MASPNPEVEFHLDGFLKDCQQMLEEYYSTKFPTLSIPEVDVKEGGKYYKVIKNEDARGRASSYVWFFVDKEEGNIWKAASWKAPAKNFPRGNILTDNAKDVIGIHGI